MKKSDREIMEILEAFDATGVAHSAAPLCKADPKTVRRYARARDLGRQVAAAAARPKLIDPFLGKIEEWVERSKGQVRADKVHERPAAMGFAGTLRLPGSGLASEHDQAVTCSRPCSAAMSAAARPEYHPSSSDTRAARS